MEFKLRRNSYHLSLLHPEPTKAPAPINITIQSSSLEAEFAEKIAKAAAKAAIETAVSELVSRKKKHTGKRLRKNNQISIAHKHLNDCGIEITKHALQHRVQRAFAQATASIPVVNVVHSPSSAISSLTAPTANTEQNEDQVPPSRRWL